jgi:hypothetical protein
MPALHTLSCFFVSPLPPRRRRHRRCRSSMGSLPTMVVGEDGMPYRGILSGLGSFVLNVPMGNLDAWLATDQLSSAPPFKRWVEKVNARYDVCFLGYCSKADKLAKNIKNFLTKESGLRVLDLATDFRPGHTIMEEIASATATCRCGLFLFTADDPLEEKKEEDATKTAIPRDNVLLEAGYFMSAHSAKRMVVVREKGLKCQRILAESSI